MYLRFHVSLDTTCQSRPVKLLQGGDAGNRPLKLFSLDSLSARGQPVRSSIPLQNMLSEEESSDIKHAPKSEHRHQRLMQGEDISCMHSKIQTPDTDPVPEVCKRI